MKIILQRVLKASLTANDEPVGEMGGGLVLLVGFEKGDTAPQLQEARDKILRLRIFEDENKKMNLSILEVGGALMIVPNFTLAGDLARGNRPSFDKAMPPQEANSLFLDFIAAFAGSGLEVVTGVFGAAMLVSLVNDGPVTFALKF